VTETNRRGGEVGRREIVSSKTWIMLEKISPVNFKSKIQSLSLDKTVLLP
jgi:hypothetical protein